MTEREFRIYPGDTFKIICPRFPPPSAPLQPPVHANIANAFSGNTSSEEHAARRILADRADRGGRRTRKNRRRS